MQPRFCYNKRAQETLAAFVNGGRFPHALLLEGPEGSGRRTFAREIAAALFCRGEHKPCGSCNQCRKVLEQNHPDVEYYGGDGSRRSFHIDTIRQLRQNAWLLPGEAPCRVCVLCGAENMTDQAQNALLKILEEPPEHTVFILTAENRAMLLPTILSRLQTIRLEPLTPAEILPVLRERCPDQPGEKLEWAAETADTIGQALALLADESLQKHAQLAQRMLACGHRRLAYIGGTEKDQAVGLARRQGVQDALNAAGLDGDKLPRLCCSAFTMEEGERCMNELLACCPDLDGVVCVTDTVALGAMRALRAAGRAIGTQVSLAGIGDSWVGGVVEPGLTTVRFYQKQVGVEAARMLLQMLEHPENGGPVRQTTLGYSVVDRGSIRIKEDA